MGDQKLGLRRALDRLCCIVGAVSWEDAGEAAGSSICDQPWLSDAPVVHVRILVQTDGTTAIVVFISHIGVPVCCGQGSVPR